MLTHTARVLCATAALVATACSSESTSEQDTDQGALEADGAVAITAGDRAKADALRDQWLFLPEPKLSNRAAAILAREEKGELTYLVKDADGRLFEVTNSQRYDATHRVGEPIRHPPSTLMPQNRYRLLLDLETGVEWAMNSLPTVGYLAYQLPLREKAKPNGLYRELGKKEIKGTLRTIVHSDRQLFFVSEQGFAPECNESGNRACADAWQRAFNMDSDYDVR